MENRKLPSAIIKYTENVFYAKIRGKYYKAIMQFPYKAIRSIDKLIQEAACIIGQSAEEMINSTDFNSTDLSSTKIESLFSELRTVNYLSSEGFTDISFIKSKRKQKRADLSAKKNGLDYIIEVTCSSSVAKRNKWRPTEIEEFIIRKIEGSQNKELQLLNTLSAYKQSCRLVLVVVLDTEDKNALNSSKDAMDIAQQVWLKKSNDHLHICIIMGKPEMVYTIPRKCLLARILSSFGYIKGTPLWTNLLIKILRISGTPVEEGSGNIVYPPWPKSETGHKYYGCEEEL